MRKCRIKSLPKLTVNTSKTLDNNCPTAEVTRLKSSVLSAASFSVVLIANGNPFDTVGFVVAGSIGHSSPITSQLILDFIGLPVFRVDGSENA